MLQMSLAISLGHCIKINMLKVTFYEVDNDEKWVEFSRKKINDSRGNVHSLSKEIRSRMTGVHGMKSARSRGHG